MSKGTLTPKPWGLDYFVLRTNSEIRAKLLQESTLKLGVPSSRHPSPLMTSQSGDLLQIAVNRRESKPAKLKQIQRKTKERAKMDERK
jgi:hypothetical protein